jgi:hypothetical protein
MSELTKYFQRFRTETIYLYNDEAERYIKSVPGQGYFAKKKGGKEYPVDSDSDTVVRAIHGRVEVTQKEYDSA